MRTWEAKCVLSAMPLRTAGQIIWPFPGTRDKEAYRRERDRPWHVNIVIKLFDMWWYDMCHPQGTAQPSRPQRTTGGASVIFSCGHHDYNQRSPYRRHHECLLPFLNVYVLLLEVFYTLYLVIAFYIVTNACDIGERYFVRIKQYCGFQNGNSPQVFRVLRV